MPDSEFVHSFCKTCGSSMPGVGERFAVIPAGSVDGDAGVRPKLHIFVGSKAPWSVLPDDGLPHLVEGPGSAPVDPG